MTEETTTSPPPRRSRRPVAAALAAVAGVALVATLAVAGGLPGSTPIPTAPPPAVATPTTVPAADDAGIVDAGWVAPGRLDGTSNPAFGAGPGRSSRLGHITITKIDGTRLSLVTDDGWTRTIDATGATITRDGATIAVGDLAVGDEIVLRQKRQADKTFKVTRIRVILPRVAGTITAVTSSNLTLTARDGTKATVKLTSSTTYRLGKDAASKAVLAVGMRAVATGTRAADGTLTATSVTVRASRVAGTVAATSGSTITLTARDGSKVTVTVTSSTIYRVAGVEKAALADVTVGMWVVATGVRGGDGSFAASAVNAGKAGPHRGWGSWKPGRGNDGGPDAASPAPSSTQGPSSEG